MEKLCIDNYKEIFNNDIKCSHSDETFKKLIDLQKLIKKESSLKELCNSKRFIIIIIHIFLL